VAPLAVPESLEQVVRGRIADIPARLRPVLELVAALERPTLPLLERAGIASAATLVEEAVRSEMLLVGADEVIRLAHPLYASSLYFGMSTARRRELHRRLADLADSDVERARHAALATAEPDVATAALVDAAAVDAASRGALDAAAALADEAARLTPADDGAARHGRLLAAARWLVETSEFDSARARLDPLLAESLPDGTRAEALLLRAECELGDRRSLVRFLREARDVATDPEQRWHALIRLAHHEGWVSGDATLAVRLAQEALEVGSALGEHPFAELASAALDYYEAARGNAPALPAPTAPDPAGRPPRMQWWQLDRALSLGVRLMWAGEIERAREALGQAFGRHVRAGREAHAGFVLCSLAELEWRAGEWGRADVHAREATERLGDVNPTAFPRALLAASCGRADEAYAIATGALAWAERNDERVAPPRFRWLLGLLELSRGDAARAHASLAEAQELLDEAGIREPSYLPVLPDLAESLVALGRLDEADAALRRLSEAAIGHRILAPAADRARASVLLGRSDAATAADLALSAAHALAAAGARFDAARALLVAGSASRRLGERRRAAALLDDAARSFRDLGAPLWLSRAEDELRRSQPRRGRERDELTAAEVRVAELVAAGRKNREVAAELYTTVATVEAHLTRIYRKLGIRSRTELARLAAAGNDRFRKPEE
jgi:DNA-binding NarL/FixJ family response regulator